MAHYAFLDDNNIVTEVIVGIDETELIEGLDPETWYSNFRGQTCKRTSYNTEGGKHKLGKTPFRKNYAGIGFLYNPILDGFCVPKPFDSWILNLETFYWEPPLPLPSSNQEGYIWQWEETSQNWVEVKVS